MAARKKEDMPNMIETFKEFKDTKKIDRATLVSVLEESFRSVIAKIFGSDENFDVIVNPDKGDFEIYRNRIVVADGEVKDEYKEVSLTDAQKIEPDYEVGEEVSERIDFAKFGRRAILNLRQTLAAKVLELEHDSLYNKYKDRVGQVISSEVYQVWKREVLLVDDENNELLLPKTEQIRPTGTSRRSTGCLRTWPTTMERSWCRHAPSAPGTSPTWRAMSGSYTCASSRSSATRPSIPSTS